METLFRNGTILTPGGFQEGTSLLIEEGRVKAVEPDGIIDEAGRAIHDLKGNRLVPGFIDIQVNGGGGVLFNHQPTLEGIKAIMAAHSQFGTTAMLPTLISDDLKVMKAAIEAVDSAIETGVPGILGIHLEGPYLSRAKKGVHNPNAFKPLDEDALDLLCSLKNGITLVTLAPEETEPELITQLVERGVIVSSGHTNATYKETREALSAGVSGFTHLFNAMSPFTSREPGAVGAALEDENSYCGIIVDGVHVDPVSIRLAMRAKALDRFILVTDAMPSVGSSETSFTLGGQRIEVDGGKCTTADGTLAGSNLDMMQALKNTVQLVGIEEDQAAFMTSRNPAHFLGISEKSGEIKVGSRADFVEYDANFNLINSWIEGRQITAS